jgi:hypothetical protein
VSGEAEYTAETSDGFLRRGGLQGIGFADTAADPRDHYHQFDSVTGGGERMTMGRIVRHILGYYDTLGAPPGTNPDWVAHWNGVHHPTQNPHGWITLDNVETTPFNIITNPDGTQRVDRYIVRETDNLWSRLQEIATNEFFYIYFDKTDTLYYTKHPMYLNVIPAVVMDFDEDCILAPFVAEPRDTMGVPQVKLHAVTDAGGTLHAEYPASHNHIYGAPEISRIRCNYQNELDEWCERHYLWLNRDYTVRMSVPGLMGLLFDIWDRVSITYTGTTANGIDIDWTEKKFWISEIVVTPSAGFTGTTAFVLEAENL